MLCRCATYLAGGEYSQVYVDTDVVIISCLFHIHTALLLLQHGITAAATGRRALGFSTERRGPEEGGIEVEGERMREMALIRRMCQRG